MRPAKRPAGQKTEKGKRKMAQKIIDRNGIVSLGAIECEEDLELLPGININPPPKDGRCDCCGRHISELTPFGEDPDDFLFDFSGAFLVKGWRRMFPFNEEADRAFQEAENLYRKEGFKNVDDYLIHKHGPEKAKEISFNVEGYAQTRSSWECSECFVLNEDEYFEKFFKRYRK
jgi:hypothetical protein